MDLLSECINVCMDIEGISEVWMLYIAIHPNAQDRHDKTERHHDADCSGIAEQHNGGIRKNVEDLGIKARNLVAQMTMGVHSLHALNLEPKSEKVPTI